MLLPASSRLNWESTSRSRENVQEQAVSIDMDSLLLLPREESVEELSQEDRERRDMSPTISCQERKKDMKAKKDIVHPFLRKKYMRLRSRVNFPCSIMG